MKLAPRLVSNGLGKGLAAPVAALPAAVVLDATAEVEVEAVEVVEVEALAEAEELEDAPKGSPF